MARQANITLSFSIPAFAALCRPQKVSGLNHLLPTLQVTSGETVKKTRDELQAELQALPDDASIDSISLSKTLNAVTIADLFDGDKLKKDLPEGTFTIENARKFAREWAEAFEKEILQKLMKESNEGKLAIAALKAEKELEPSTETAPTE